MMHEAVTK